MDTTEVEAVLDRLLGGLPSPPTAREEIRVWARSGVERLHLADGTSVVFKYAEGPFMNEHAALDVAEHAGLPVPGRLGAVRSRDLLGMLLDDLGPVIREATDQEGAAWAVAVHRVGETGSLPVVDAQGLAAMPGRMLDRFRRLDLADPMREAAQALDKVASRRAEGAESPPFGLCHSEWHPTSLHVGHGGVHLLDFARAFRGPGLLDLASWHGTLDKPDIERLTSLIEDYLKAGGPASAAEERGGLPAARWALGWHRVWAADWFTYQLTIGWADGAEEAWTTAITRHLTEAVDLLG
ncbi:aminoglycoside phosphotransferase [Actinocorallia populi]|uniref:aminoglycoside phosphotransferase n=1 Tax=Actinocorallia populi TaxID=2079200 RepID=UPI000D088021|nr:aminoglycoside phosphotransferase [Actinocorallia populi]